MPLPELPADAKSRGGVLKDTDSALAPTIQTVLSAEQDAVLMYITTPPMQKTQHQGDQHDYEMDDPYPSSMHTDLKRDVYPRQDSSSGEMQAGLPLFEKYQFLTPGMCTATMFCSSARLMHLQACSWVFLWLSCYSPSSTSASAPSLIWRSATWHSARRWARRLRRSNSSDW